jgi:hypothetical protein
MLSILAQLFPWSHIDITLELDVENTWQVHPKIMISVRKFQHVSEKLDFCQESTTFIGKVRLFLEKFDFCQKNPWQDGCGPSSRNTGSGILRQS